MPSKMATPGLLKMKIFSKKGYDVIVYVHDVTKKILSSDSNYIVDPVMWRKFRNPSISTREVIVISILFNNLGLAIAMSLKFYISVARRLKLKFRKFWGLVPTFLEVTGEKLVGGAFLLPPTSLPPPPPDSE